MDLHWGLWASLLGPVGLVVGAALAFLDLDFTRAASSYQPTWAAYKALLFQVEQKLINRFLAIAVLVTAVGAGIGPRASQAQATVKIK